MSQQSLCTTVHNVKLLTNFAKKTKSEKRIQENS